MTDDACLLPHRSDPERPRRTHRGRLCAGHYRRLGDDLASLPVLHATLSGYLVRTGGGDGGRRGDSESVGISLDPGVVRARDHIRVTLVAWTRIALEEGPWRHAPDDTPIAIVEWLARRLDWMAAQPWADEFAANIAETVREARAQVQPNTTYRIELGPCPIEILAMDGDQVTSEPCPGTVVAVMRKAASREQLPSEVVCTAHGDDEEEPHIWGPMQWHALGRRMGRSLHDSAAEAFMRSVSGA